jgi:hypothetical protein
MRTELMSSFETIDLLPISNVRVEANTGTLSDHFLVSLQTKFSYSKKTRDYTERTLRELVKIDIAEFRNDIAEFRNCSDLNLSEFKSLDDTVDQYLNVLEQLLDKHAPLITRTFCKERSEFWNGRCQIARREQRKAKRKSKNTQMMNN